MRFNSLDSTRGIILIMMALDHAKDLIMREFTFVSESWSGQYAYYNDFSLFFSRFITHLCAPAFAFMMGLSMMLLCKSNTTVWKKETEIWKYFFKRGIVLIILEVILFSPIWSYAFKSENISYEFGVLGMLGTSMIICSFFLKRHWSMSFATVIFGLISSIFFITNAPKFDLSNLLLKILFIPDITSVVYPIFPWLSVSLLGMLFGKILIKNQKIAFKLILPSSIVFLTLFVIARNFGGIAFNLRPDLSLTDGNWWSFFYVVKYPPSMVYLLFTLGTFFLIFYVFNKLENLNPKKYRFLFSLLNIFKVYGKTTFFFYALHLPILLIIGIIFYNGFGLSSLPIAILGWIGLLLILYPLCKKYQKFKKTKNHNSIWKLF